MVQYAIKFVIEFLMCVFLFKCRDNLPKGFVYLDEINPNIIVNLRYFNSFNFIAAKVNGYKVNRAIMTKEAALALNRTWKIMNSLGYNLVVYDAYRPQKAVDQFVQWSQDPNANQTMKAFFYPYVNHSDVIMDGYVAEKSGHTRGSTVDISVIAKGKQLKPINAIMRNLTDGRTIMFLDDNTINMGSSFDLFDVASYSVTSLVNNSSQIARNKLIQIMNATGFDNYSKEWWHFTLRNEPFPDTYFNFDIQ